MSGHVDVPIPQAAGQSNVEVRFHFTGTFGWWWGLDNVFIGTRTCSPTPGGLVAGVVSDNNTGAPLNGAKVASDTNSSQFGVSAANPADPNLANGFYWLFASPGSTPFTASDGAYTSSTATVNVAANFVTQQNWSLHAGHLTVTPGSISSTQTLGGSKTATVKFTDDGTEPVQVKIGEQNGGFTPMTGQKDTGAPAETIAGKFTPEAGVVAVAHGAKAHDARLRTGLRMSTAGPADAPWTAIANYPSPIMDNAVGYDASSGKVYSVAGFNGSANVASGFVYDPSAQSWSPIADMPQALEAPMAGFIQGKLYVVGGWDSSGNASTAGYVYDPGSNAWSAIANLPSGISAGAAAVLNDQLYIVGGCTTGFCTPTANTVYRYDPGSNAWTQLANYPNVAAFAGCAGISSEVVCAGGLNADTNGTYTSTFIYNPGTNSWSQGANMPYDDWAMAASGSGNMLQVAGGVTNNGAAITNQAAEYDPSSNTWAALPNANNAEYRGGGTCGMYKIGGSTGQFAAQSFAEVLPGFASCGAEDVPWLSESTTALTLQPGQSANVTVTMDSSAVSQPGAYAAKLVVNTNSPYQVTPVSVSMQANPPSTWGKITGTVTDASTGNPIAGATVQICTMYVLSNGTCGPVTYTLKTDSSGSFQLWLNQGFNPLQVIAAKDGYQPVSRVIKIIKGQTTTVTFALNKSS